MSYFKGDEHRRSLLVYVTIINLLIGREMEEGGGFSAEKKDGR